MHREVGIKKEENDRVIRNGRGNKTQENMKRMEKVKDKRG